MLEKILNGAESNRRMLLNKLKESSKPVVVYEAAHTAERVATFLNDNNISISSFFVDDKHYIPNKTIKGIKVLSIEELNKKFKFYNVVFGFFEYEKAKKIIESGIFNSKGMTTFFDDAGNFDYEYFKSNSNKFQETYDLLCDDL